MKRILIALIRFYKRAISPLLPNACKYTPTCSEYAMEAIEVHGALKGRSRVCSVLLPLPPDTAEWSSF